MSQANPQSHTHPRRGLFYTTDLLFAILLITTGILILTRLPLTPPPPADPQGSAESILNVLDTLRVNETRLPVIESLRANGTLTVEEENLTLLEYAYTLAITNRTSIAQQLLREALANVSIPIAILTDGMLLYNTTPLAAQRIASSRSLTGYEPGRKLRGYAATLYLTRVKQRERTVILTTGGFTGEGNITLTLTLPDDYQPANVTRIHWTYQSGTAYSIRMNNQACDTLPAARNVSRANLTRCASLLTPGENTIILTTTRPYNESYLSGSTLTITYLTNTFIPPRHGWLSIPYPRVQGFINLYDGLIIPGRLTGMNISLAYEQARPEGVNSSIYLTLGGTLIYTNNATRDRVLITNSTLASLLNYSQLETTLPLRVGTDGIDELILIEDYTPSTTILVTDVSGSMSECGEYTQPLTCWYYCWPSGWTHCTVNEPDECTDNVCGASCWFTWAHQLECNRTKLEIAQAADHQAVDTLLNYSKNRVGLVAYESGVRSIENPTSTASILHNEINSYYANGGTCICCGIYRAVDMLATDTNPLKFIIVLSDGDANYKCENVHDYTGTYVGAGSEASQSTIQAGQYACSQNITVYTVGFGSAMSSLGVSTLIQTACNESLYYNASNMSLLNDIYENISKTILGMSNYSSQIVTIQGAYEANLTDLTINLTYEPPIPDYQPYEFPIQEELQPFTNCTAIVTIPEGMRVYDATLSVYSGEYWVASITLNNKTQYNLTAYNVTYKALGDPHEYYLNPADFTTGNNTITLRIEDAQHNTTNCNENTTLHLTLLARFTAGESTILPKAEGCAWNLTLQDGSTITLSIPPTAIENCTYNPPSYPTDDAYAVAAYNLFKTLDFDNDGRVNINLSREDLTFRLTTRQSVPRLLGPGIVTAITPR